MSRSPSVCTGQMNWTDENTGQVTAMTGTLTLTNVSIGTLLLGGHFQIMAQLEHNSHSLISHRKLVRSCRHKVHSPNEQQAVKRAVLQTATGGMC